MKPVFRVSTIASLCGFNVYSNKDKSKIVDLLFHSYSKIYDTTNINYKNNDQLFNELIDKSPKLKEMINENKKINLTDTTTLKKNIADIISSIDTTLYNEDELIFLDGQINKLFTTRYGTFNENNTIELLKSDHNIEVLGNNEETYSKEYSDFIVEGHIDGHAIINDVKTLIEIKNRKNKLFKNIVLYEEIQVLFYLQILGLKKAILVEQYNKNLYINEYNTLNKQLYLDCVNRLHQISDFFKVLHEEPELRVQIFEEKKYDILPMFLFWM
jgi:hypothetical protein